MEIYPLGHFNDKESPGKRWKFSLLSGITNQGEQTQSMIFFGGHRLWHGFSMDNSQENSWDSFKMLPKGGFLDDLWIYTKRSLLPDEEVPMNSDGYGEWTVKTGVKQCERSPGLEVSRSAELRCSILCHTLPSSTL